MQGGGFHPRNLVDFTLKSGGFQPWNLVDFTQISPVKSTQNYKSKCFSKNSSVWWMQGGGYDQGFHEIHQISPWNLVDFTCEIQQSSPRFHLWNPPKIIKASVLAKTLQFDECKVGAMTKDFMKSAWNPPDFMKSGGFHVKSKDIWQGIVTLCFYSVTRVTPRPHGPDCMGVAVSANERRASLATANERPVRATAIRSGSSTCQSGLLQRSSRPMTKPVTSWL